MISGVRPKLFSVFAKGISELAATNLASRLGNGRIPKLLAGKPRATLQLASGKTVFLTSDSSRSIEPEYGVEIRQDSG